MKIETKFDIGDKLHWIIEDSRTERAKECSLCGHSKYENITKWRVSDDMFIITKLVIGGDEVRYFNQYGTKVCESNLFTRTIKAQAACDKRNKES